MQTKAKKLNTEDTKVTEFTENKLAGGPLLSETRPPAHTFHFVLQQEGCREIPSGTADFATIAR